MSHYFRRAISPERLAKRTETAVTDTHLPLRRVRNVLKRYTGVVAVWFGALSLPAQADDSNGGIPTTWFERHPTPEIIREIVAMGRSQGYGPVGSALSAGALRAFEANQFEVAESWLYVGFACGLLSQEEVGYAAQWTALSARAGYVPAVPYDPAPPGAVLGDRLNEEFTCWLLNHRAAREALFELLSPYDYLPAVLSILQELQAKDARVFESYLQLALAVALVYDVAPPPDWPHPQVAPDALRRRLPTPSDAFDFFTRADRSGSLLHRLIGLRASELKFMVDLAAAPAELSWAQKSLAQTLGDLAATYDLIQYRHDRIQLNQYVWPGDDYRLPTILAQGGICVDQAYFASQAGKARGVPTLIFRGAGRDGRHAWFGFLGPGRRWNFEAGRYDEQRFVIGIAHDPQTWQELSDHELSFLSEGFRESVLFRRARIYAVFAEVYRQRGDSDRALATARKGVNSEPRYRLGWEALIEAQRSAEMEPKKIEATLREAAIALSRYPDLSAVYAKRLAASLRERGEISAAEQEERLLARRNQQSRTDITLEQLGQDLARALKTKPAFEQARQYHAMLEQFGRGQGMDFFERIVAPYARHLQSQGLKREGRLALDKARATLQVEPGGQLDRELAELELQFK